MEATWVMSQCAGINQFDSKKPNAEKKVCNLLISMSGSSTALIIVLVFGVLFAMLLTSALVSVQRHAPNLIPTEPRISQLQAIETVEQDLREEVDGFKEVNLYHYQYNFSASRYESGDSKYLDYILSIAHEGGWSLSHIKKNPELLQLPLFFIHANGTQYQVNSTDHTFQLRCLKAPDLDSCAMPLQFANAARDRLIFLIETKWEPSTKEVSYNEGYHAIDAETGELVVNSIDLEKHRSRLAPPPDIDYEGHKTIARRLHEMLNPPEVTRISIVGGDQHFVPQSARGLEGISSKIVWTNEDNVPHTIISTEDYSNPYTGSLDSGIILPNGTYEYTLVEVGEYPYFCALHPHIQATVIIVESFD